MLPEFREAENISSESKILGYENAIVKIRECRERGLRVILAQGAFDIVHIGHLDYFRSARKVGDVLFVGVENDDSIRQNKGSLRPANSLQERLDFLSELESINFVFGFTDTPKYEESIDLYTQRFKQLNPNFIAISSWDPNIEIKKIQAERAGVELVTVNYALRDSTTRLLKLIGYE